MSDKLEVTKENLQKAFSQATDDGKKLLSNLFGETAATAATSEDVDSKEMAAILACYVKIGLDRSAEIPFKDPRTKRQRRLNAICDLDVIRDANIGDWVPDWSNSNQSKYEPSLLKTLRGSASRARIAMAGTRARVSARAFAFQLPKWQ